MGYYLIVTDTEATERCFFIGLHQALPEDVRNKLVIKVVETKTRTLMLIDIINWRRLQMYMKSVLDESCRRII